MKLNQDIKAILFDLDGTLININLDKFVKNYVLLLSNFVKDLVSPRKFIPRLMKVSKLVENNDGTSSNESVFAENFFPLEGYTRADLEPIFDEFYINEFNKLRKYTKIKEEAYSTIKKAFEKNYNVVIATTPLLPETAIKQRLDWAGVGEFDYDLITSFEYVSATKPNLLYFQEISRKIGVPIEKCVMVGDEDKDMVAKKLGCKTFLINNENTDLSDDTPTPDFEGTLSDFRELI
ncbi:MAG: HAD hydrolase-like protein [Candidatus Lokiarchaeota archaeon]|nr:HAD hydrolase-like protein [Candidatus Lokiarchaeota archaeon]MBD3200489.1 HAD hydrolase-like protein [Candidatus Lokiarchaeota archaeon]